MISADELSQAVEAARAQGRREAFLEAAVKCRELGSLSDPDMGEREGLLKAARFVEALATPDVARGR